MKLKLPAIAIALMLPLIARAQSAAADSSKTPGFEDNSFLVEEAYNQDAGVVQHINSLSVDRTGKTYEYDFTEEWPVGGIKNQLSYTIPIVHAAPGRTRVGDVLLNYRYQLIGDGDAAVAVSPRFSVALPTGNWKTGTGRGAAGYEGFLPASIVVSKLLVTHFNAGARFTPGARDEAGDRAGVWKVTLAASGILRLSSTFHLMLESVWSKEDNVVAPRRTVADNSWVISPGARIAFNYKSGLQVVPGIGFPIGVGPSRGDRGLFLYLSFEHPFSDAGREK